MSQVFYVPAPSAERAALYVSALHERPQVCWLDPDTAVAFAEEHNASNEQFSPVDVYRVERHFDGLITAAEYDPDETTIGRLAFWACFALAVAFGAGVWIFL